MSYSTDRDNTSVYSAGNDYGMVNTVPDYRTLSHYYSKPRCPYTSQPGSCAVTPVYITPTFGGTGYKTLGHNLPGEAIPDSNYFSLNTAYPAWPYQACSRPLCSQPCGRQ